MKLTDKISNLRPGTPFYTFEFFPPRTDQVPRESEWRTQLGLTRQIEQGFNNLISRIERMSALRPAAVSITWSAGGSTKDRSLHLAGLCQYEQRVDTIMHLTCTNMQIGMVDDALRVCHL
jgi:methylenetetrahydrofolate reductase (NADPH)